MVLCALGYGAAVGCAVGGAVRGAIFRSGGVSALILDGG